MPVATFTILSPEGRDTPVEVEAAEPLFALGRNGTGKSALLSSIATQLTGKPVIYMPGARQSYFENESLSMTPAGWRQYLVNNTHWDQNPDTRWKGVNAQARNESSLHFLQSSELQYKIDAAESIKKDGPKSEWIARLQENESPLDRLNQLFRQSNLPVSLRLDQAELKSIRADTPYSVARMSDGERSALILAGCIIPAATGSIFVIDEPERHLHRAIAVPLLASLIAERTDCAFIISTHEIELCRAVTRSRIIILRECVWQNPKTPSWKFSIIDQPDAIPEEVRLDILGSRQKILFIEGGNASLDQPLYEQIFPNASVKAKEACVDVRKAVLGLRSSVEHHHVQAYGLVDGDGMTAEETTSLRSEDIFALPIYSVESIYFSNHVIADIAQVQAASLGLSAADLLADAQEKALQSLRNEESVKRLASRACERRMRFDALKSLPSHKDLVNGATDDIAITIRSPYPTELRRLQKLIDARDLGAITSAYPIRESGIPNAIASSLRYRDVADFHRAVQARVKNSEELKARIKEMLGGLPQAIAQ